MRATRILSILICALMVMPLCGHAVGATTTLPDRVLTLKDCIEYALNQHSSVLIAEKDLTASKADVTRAKSGYLPKITASSDYSSGGTKNLSTSTGTIDRSSSGTSSVVGVTETLYDAGRTVASVRQATASERATAAALDLTKQTRILTVTSAYFDVLRTQKLADIASQAVAESQGQYELVQARIDAGDGAKVDIYQVEVELANAKLNKIQADNDVRVAGNTLRNTMGLDRGKALQLQDVSEPSADVPSLDDSLASALKDRPEIIRALAQVDSAKASLTLAKQQAVPLPTANASYDQNLGGSGFDNEWSVGVGVTLNIFSSGFVSAGIRSARSQSESSALAMDQSRKDVSADVEEAYLNLTNALERLVASKPNLDMAQKNLEVMREKYKQGLAITLELVTAQRSYADAQAAYAQALYDCYVARATLDKAVGKRGY